MRLIRKLQRVAFCLVLFFGSWAHAEARQPQIGKRVADFELKTHRGQPWSLQTAKDKKLIVVIFLGTECPLAQLYGPRLGQLHNEFANQGVAFVGINSNTQDSVTEISAYVARHKLRFPVLKDLGNRVADQMGATRTPEVFVLDQERRIQYHGRIDDQYLVGLARPKPQRRDLALAVGELLAGKKVTEPKTESAGCLIGRVRRTKPKGAITYAKHIAPIFNKRCVECHRKGEIAPFSLTSYQYVLGWEDTILEVIADNRMPPWFASPGHLEFSNDARLSDKEKKTIRQWVANGMPKGNDADLPAPPKFPQGWRVRQPDQTIYMSKRPFEVRAEGVVDYQYFRADPGWKEDKYITVAEARPDNTAVVHHIVVYVLPPGAGRGDATTRDMLVGYAPGANPSRLPPGVAIHVPAGSQLLFEMHYTPNGTKQTDRSFIGVSFTDKKNVKKTLKGRMAVNPRIRIRPRSKAQFRSYYEVPRDELLVSMTPHMHLRGKSFRYEAFFPDGRNETLLEVPHYDFNWQLTYKLAKPRLLPKGTRIRCTAVFDNTDDNPVNPDSSELVKWGDQSWQEMMIGFLTVIDADRKPVKSVVGKVLIDPTGTWTWKDRNRSQAMTLKLEGDKLTGIIDGYGRKTSIENPVLSGDRLQFEINLPLYKISMRFDARLTKDKLTGVISVNMEAIGQRRKLGWKAERAAKKE